MLLIGLRRTSLVIVFFAIILAPIAAMVLDYDKIVRQYQRAERRQLANFPALPKSLLGINDWSTKFERYFNDHFAFRHKLNNINSYLGYKFFSRIPNDRILIGEDGWFFDGHGEDRANAEGETFTYDELKSLSEDKKFDGKELERRANIFKKRAQSIEEKGGKYFFAVAPKKHLLYPEYLPAALRTSYSRNHRYHQLIQYLKQHAGSTLVVDLLKSLESYKRLNALNFPLYFKTDGHWNKIGAYYAYRSVVDAIKEAFPEKHISASQLQDFDLGIEQNWSHAGFAARLGFQVAEPFPELKIKPEAPLDAVRAWASTFDSTMAPEGFKVARVSSSLSREGAHGAMPRIKYWENNKPHAFGYANFNQHAPFNTVLVVGDSFIAKAEIFFSNLGKEVFYCGSRLRFCPDYFTLARKGIVPYPELVIHVVAPEYAFRG